MIFVERKVQVGNVVKEYKRGNTRIKICDDCYRDNTPEDVERILKRITDIGLRYLKINEISQQ